MDVKTALFGALIGFLSAVLTDLDAYQKARKEDPGVKFDWGLAFVRWFRGAILGTGVGSLAQ